MSVQKDPWYSSCLSHNDDEEKKKKDNYNWQFCRFSMDVKLFIHIPSTYLSHRVRNFIIISDIFHKIITWLWTGNFHCGSKCFVTNSNLLTLCKRKKACDCVLAIVSGVVSIESELNEVIQWQQNHAIHTSNIFLFLPC